MRGKLVKVLDGNAADLAAALRVVNALTGVLPDRVGLARDGSTIVAVFRGLGHRGRPLWVWQAPGGIVRASNRPPVFYRG